MTEIKFFKNRRGISTVVGALFFTVLMIAGFSALALALDAQTDIVNTQRMISETELKKQQERFSIGASTDVNNNLEIFVNNHGQNPVEIASVWIINKTLSDQPAQRFTIPSDSAYVSSGYGSQILSSLPLTMTPDEYDIKVVSTYGTIEQTELSVNGVSSSNVLRSQLFTVPPDVISGQNVTIAMLVTNTADFTLESVSPGSNPPFTDKPSGLLASQLTSPNSVTLEPKDTILFKWNAEISGSLGSNMNFTNYAKGIEPDGGTLYTSANSTDSVTLQIDGGDDGTLIALSKDLLHRPEIFAIIPSPQGDSNSQALWGLNVVNPTNSTMEISKVVIAAFAPGSNNNDKIFASPCDANGIFPDIGYNNWECSTENTILWKNQTHPVVLPPYSTQSFMANVTIGSLSANKPQESIIVQPSVFTTLGSFGKADYQTTMADTSTSIVSVYLLDGTTFKSDHTGIPPNNLETFTIALSDLDNESETIIRTGAKLIINVPREWKDVQIINNNGFVDNPPLSPKINNFGDGTTQIVAETLNELGDNVNNSATITFEARAPSITNDQMYVMYVLADGETENTGTSTVFTMGPLAEILLHVDSP